ncbi:NAD(P)-binding domain-containing protein [Streptomyces sp. HD1123-B1]|uniref:NAD(P)-dependent oxidoreductase n=1 Tax=Streptomyces huangiella TaxID=3228804 RepID=UPI003D7EF0C0
MGVGGQSVTVIGLGPMGQAMVRALLARGYEVTVWNRTARKADGLVADGAVLAPSVEEALAANELVILSLTDYDAMYAVLEPATAALAGKVVANLSSDTPRRAREAAQWAAGHGAGYLTAGVAVSPSLVGTPEGYAYYSGPKDLLEAHWSTLEVISRVEYRGEDPGLAALYYQIQMDLFWTSMTAWLHSVAVAEANGISVEEILPFSEDVAASLPHFFRFYAPRLAAGDHTGDVDRLAMGVASMEHVVDTVRAAEVDAALPEAVLDVFRRGAAAGHADDSFTVLREVFTAGGSPRGPHGNVG